jgi:ABC-type transporter Mla subunit MlaD
VEKRHTDFLVGLFILVSVGVIVGTLVLTSGWGEGRYDIYMRSTTAEHLNQDTRVIIQGLEIGVVTQVNPVVDPSTGELSFVAQLTIRDRFPDGSVLHIPVGTRATIARPTPIEAPVILLTMPERIEADTHIESGDTIQSDRQASVLDALGAFAATMREEIPAALDETRRVMGLTAQALTQARELMSATRPQAEAALERLSRSLERTEEILQEEQARLGPLHDTLDLVLSDTRTVLARYDSLAVTALAMSNENREDIRAAIEQLARSAEILQNFAERVSRRPLRLLTGVQPPPPDTGKMEQ